MTLHNRISGSFLGISLIECPRGEFSTTAFPVLGLHNHATTQLAILVQFNSLSDTQPRPFQPKRGARNGQWFHALICMCQSILQLVSFFSASFPPSSLAKGMQARYITNATLNDLPAENSHIKGSTCITPVHAHAPSP